MNECMHVYTHTQRFMKSLLEEKIQNGPLLITLMYFEIYVIIRHSLPCIIIHAHTHLPYTHTYIDI